MLTDSHSAVRLLVNLTTPALVLYEEELPGERVSRRYYLEVIQYLQAYKEAFTDKVFWEALTARMAALLEKVGAWGDLGRLGRWVPWICAYACFKTASCNHMTLIALLDTRTINTEYRQSSACVLLGGSPKAK